MQRFGEGLGWGFEVKAFSWGVIVGGNELSEASVWERCEVGFAGHEAAHSSDGVFDTALLPGRVGIAEEGADRQAVQLMMAGEFGAVVEGDGLTQLLGQSAEQIEEMTGNAVSGLAGQPDRQQEAGLALVHGQDGLTVFGEHHQVGFPMAAGLSIGGRNRAFRQGNTAFNEVLRAAALPGRGSRVCSCRAADNAANDSRGCGQAGHR